MSWSCRVHPPTARCRFTTHTKPLKVHTVCCTSAVHSAFQNNQLLQDVLCLKNGLNLASQTWTPRPKWVPFCPFLSQTSAEYTETVVGFLFSFCGCRWQIQAAVRRWCFLPIHPTFRQFFTHWPPNCRFYQWYQYQIWTSIFLFLWQTIRSSRINVWISDSRLKVDSVQVQEPQLYAAKHLKVRTFCS